MIDMTSTSKFSLLASGLLGFVSNCVFAVPEFAQQQQGLALSTSKDLPLPLSTSEYALSHVAHEPHLSDSSASCKLTSNGAHYLNEGFDPDPFTAYAPSTGILRATMIFVDFHDAEASESTTDLYQHFMPAASEWYRNSSFGRLNLQVTADFSQFYRMPHNSSWYGYRRGNGAQFHVKYIREALSVVDRNVSFEDTSVLYIVPTREATEISYSPTCMTPVEATDGTIINNTVTFGQDMYYFGFKVMNHETGHTMGLSDLYSYELHTSAAIFVGGFDLMAQIEGISPDFLAWHKWRLGWIDDGQVVCLGSNLTERNTKKYTLTPIEDAGGVKALVVRYNATFAIVAEYRSARGLNTNACGTGVLIYTVRTIVPTGRGPIRVQDSSPRTGCAGARLNDALFLSEPRDRSTYIGWGINITVIEETKEGFVVEVSQD